MKHTPGPWEVLDGAIVSKQVNAYGNFIVVNCERERTEEDAANLDLIAAAPELAEMGSLLLRTVWDTLRHGLTDGQRESLEAVGKEFASILAKAEGREGK